MKSSSKAIGENTNRRQKAVKNILTATFGVAFIFILSGCSVSYRFLNTQELISNYGYAKGTMPFKLRSNSLNSFLPGKKGEWTLSADGGGGASVHFGWSITNHSAVYFKGSYLAADDKATEMKNVHLVYTSSENNDTNSVSAYVYRHHKLFYQDLLEAGYGLYHTSESSPFRWEGFAGVSIGSANNNYNYSSPAFIGNGGRITEARKFAQAYAQYNIGFRKKHGEVIALSRLSLYHFYAQEFDASNYTNDLDKYAASPFALALEEGIRVGTGGEKVRLFLQCDFAIPLAKEKNLEFYAVNLKGGVAFQFGLGKKK